MILDWKLETPRAKVLVAILSLFIISLLAVVATSNFLVGVLTDERVRPPKELLQSAISYFPNSARLNAQLARSELADEERDLSLAEFYAKRAVNLSPADYLYPILLASVEEAKDNRQGAEDLFRQALALAPNNADAHWRFANLLLRRGKPDEAVNEFRFANSSSPRYLPTTLDLIWRASGGSLDAVEAVTPNTAKAKFSLAQFLLNHSLIQEAGKMIGSLDRNTRLQSAETPKLLNAILATGEYQLARDLWLNTVSEGATKSAGANLLWNDGFEVEPVKGFGQFDWGIASNSYARLAIDRNLAHTGERSLRVDFAGKDTTRLDGELKQLVPIHPGARYRLTFFARAEQLVTPEGPRIAIIDAKSGRPIASSEALRAESNDWQQISFEFVVPADVRAVLVTLQRIPKFSYDDPTQGIVWFDDFSLREQTPTK